MLYKFDYLDNQWFVIVNYPLLQEQIGNAVEIYAEERGFEEARYIPMENLVYCTLRDLCEAIEPTRVRVVGIITTEAEICEVSLRVIASKS